jgi:hypothetical protein
MLMNAWINLARKERSVSMNQAVISANALGAAKAIPTLVVASASLKPKKNAWGMKIALVNWLASIESAPTHAHRYPAVKMQTARQKITPLGVAVRADIRKTSLANAYPNVEGSFVEKTLNASYPKTGPLVYALKVRLAILFLVAPVCQWDVR